MKTIINEMKLRLPAISVNEGVARSAVSAFIAELDPTVEELGDIRLAVSEAVTNCIVHAYRDLPRGEVGNIYISVRLYSTKEVSVEISDNGCGIENVEEAMRPAFDPVADIISSEISKLGAIRHAHLEYCQYSSRYDRFKSGEVLNAFDPQICNSALADIGNTP